MGSRIQYIQSKKEVKGIPYDSVKWRSHDDNYATNLENNQARFEQGGAGFSEKVSFRQKRKEIAASLIILKGYSHLTDRKFGMNYYRYIENEANVKKKVMFTIRKKLHKKGNSTREYMLHSSQCVLI